MKYEIYAGNMKEVRAKLDRINERLIAIDRQPVTCTEVGYVDKPHRDGTGYVERYIQVEVSTPTAALNGWEFMATLAHTEEGNIIRAVPGYEVPTDYRDNPCRCQHCNVSRNRKDTYVVRHSDGRTRQVGSSCIQEFLGTTDRVALRAVTSVLNACDILECAQSSSWLNGGTRVDCRLDTETFLANVAAIVRVEGKYVTRKMSMDHVYQATSDRALYNMNSRAVMVLPEDYKMAEDAIAYVIYKLSDVAVDLDAPDVDVVGAVMDIHSKINRSGSDFEHNLLTCARASSIEQRFCGITAYIIEYYRRTLVMRASKAAPTLDANGLKRVVEMLDLARQTLKSPTIRLAEGDVKLSLTLAGENSRNPGCIYVKGSEYLGKITPEGRFFSVKGSLPKVEALLQAFATQPDEYAAKYGQMTGRCCFCGLRLSDERSTKAGYGPVCAKNFGLGEVWKAKTAALEKVDSVAVAA